MKIHPEFSLKGLPYFLTFLWTFLFMFLYLTGIMQKISVSFPIYLLLLLSIGWSMTVGFRNIKRSVKIQIKSIGIHLLLSLIGAVFAPMIAIFIGQTRAIFNGTRSDSFAEIVSGYLFLTLLGILPLFSVILFGIIISLVFSIVLKLIRQLNDRRKKLENS